jgi:hypothetical protein
MSPGLRLFRRVEKETFTVRADETEDTPEQTVAKRERVKMSYNSRSLNSTRPIFNE